MRQGQVVVPERLFISSKDLRQLAYKKIFEGLNYFEEKRLEFNIENYPRKSNLTSLERDSVSSIIGVLVVNEEGGFAEMKEKVKKFKLDYKTIYGVN